MEEKKVFLYAISTCPWCRKTKQFFTDNHVEFDFVDVDLLEGEEQEKVMDEVYRLSGARAFPVVIIGEATVVGYRPDRYKELLKRKNRSFLGIP
ncbi:MAG: glutaredoxin family protein [Candidatus Bipolaricaulis sp.]|jgi:glutaredoxin